jgi:hypothetical protein
MTSPSVRAGVSWAYRALLVVHVLAATLVDDALAVGDPDVLLAHPQPTTRLRQAMAAAPAPEQTSLTSPIRLPTTSSPLSSAAAATIAVPCWVVVEHRDPHPLAQAGLDLEATRAT